MTRDVSDVTHLEEEADIWEKSVSWVLGPRKTVDFRGSSWPDEFVRYGRRALVGLRTDDVKAVSIVRLCLSLPYVEKPFNSKVIKSFVPEPRSRKRFSCFGIPMLSIYIYIYIYMCVCVCVLWTFYVRFTHFTYSCMAMLQYYSFKYKCFWQKTENLC